MTTDNKILKLPEGGQEYNPPPPPPPEPVPQPPDRIVLTSGATNFIRYKNRKIYNLHTHRYSTILTIAEHVRQGETVVIWCRETNRDITEKVFQRNLHNMGIRFSLPQIVNLLERDKGERKE